MPCFICRPHRPTTIFFLSFSSIGMNHPLRKLIFIYLNRGLSFAFDFFKYLLTTVVWKIRCIDPFKTSCLVTMGRFQAVPWSIQRLTNTQEVHTCPVTSARTQALSRGDSGLSFNIQFFCLKYWNSQGFFLTFFLSRVLLVPKKKITFTPIF